MTDDEINRAIHKNIEGFCDGLCVECSSNTALDGCINPLPRNYLADGNYILGLMIKLLLAHRDAGFTIRSRYFYYNRPGDHNDRTIPTFSVLIKPVISVETLKRAIALAAIKKAGEK